MGDGRRGERRCSVASLVDPGWFLVWAKSREALRRHARSHSEQDISSGEGNMWPTRPSPPPPIAPTRGGTRAGKRALSLVEEGARPLQVLCALECWCTVRRAPQVQIQGQGQVGQQSSSTCAPAPARIHARHNGSQARLGWPILAAMRSALGTSKLWPCTGQDERKSKYSVHLVRFQSRRA